MIYTILLISVLALIGLPSFISNYSKEFIITTYISLFNITIYILLLVSIVLTLIYSLKLLLIFCNYIFFKKSRISLKYNEFPYFSLLIITLPITLFWFSFYIKFNYLLSNINIENYYYINSNINFYNYKDFFLILALYLLF